MWASQPPSSPPCFHTSCFWLSRIAGAPWSGSRATSPPGPRQPRVGHLCCSTLILQVRDGQRWRRKRTAVLFSGTRPQCFLRHGGDGRITVRAFTCPGLMRKCFVFTEKLFYLLWPFTCSWVATIGVFGWYKGSSSEPGVPVPPGQCPDPALGLSPSQGAAWSLRDHRGL